MRQVGRDEAILKLSYILKQRLSPSLVRLITTPKDRHVGIEVLAAFIVDDLPWELLIDTPEPPEMRR